MPTLAVQRNHTSRSIWAVPAALHRGSRIPSVVAVELSKAKDPDPAIGVAKEQSSAPWARSCPVRPRARRMEREEG